MPSEQNQQQALQYGVSVSGDQPDATYTLNPGDTVTLAGGVTITADGEGISLESGGYRIGLRPTTPPPPPVRININGMDFDIAILEIFF